MLLVNKTKIPDHLVIKLLNKAAAFVGVDIENLAFKLNTNYCKREVTGVYRKHATYGWQNEKTRYSSTLKSCNGFIIMRWPKHPTDTSASVLYEVMVHELVHYLDKLSKKYFNNKLKYMERPQEIRAYKTQDLAIETMKNDREIQYLITEIRRSIKWTK